MTLWNSITASIRLWTNNRMNDIPETETKPSWGTQRLLPDQTHRLKMILRIKESEGSASSDLGANIEPLGCTPRSQQMLRP